MMPLEQQVVSLDLARKLKELGVKQESAFYWFPFGRGVHRWQVTDRILDAEALKGWRSYEKNSVDFEFFASFTVAELGQFLTKQQIKNAMDGSVGSEANSRARMLIHLIETGSVKP